ncbi:MAG: cytochrome b5 domain-containing protein [Clostridia bacterium]
MPADYGKTVFTLTELARYNGNDGMPAYIAVDGIVYDVTNVGAWRNGRHNGFTAGKDLTEEINNISPHGTSTLAGLPVAGTLSE